MSGCVLPVRALFGIHNRSVSARRSDKNEEIKRHASGQFTERDILERDKEHGVLSYFGNFRYAVYETRIFCGLPPSADECRGHKRT